PARTNDGRAKCGRKESDQPPGQGRAKAGPLPWAIAGETEPAYAAHALSIAGKRSASLNGLATQPSASISSAAPSALVGEVITTIGTCRPRFANSRAKALPSNTGM